MRRAVFAAFLCVLGASGASACDAARARFAVGKTFSDALAGQAEAVLTEEAVRGALDHLLREDDAFYTQLWNQLTPVQQKALVAAVREGGVELLSHRVTRAHGLSAASMSRAIQSLQEKEVLRTEESRGKLRLRLVDPFFGAWLDLVMGKS